MTGKRRCTFDKVFVYKQDNSTFIEVKRPNEAIQTKVFPFYYHDGVHFTSIKLYHFNIGNAYIGICKLDIIKFKRRKVVR
jgi:hypothetical protein